MQVQEKLRSAYLAGLAKGRAIVEGSATVSDGIRYWRDSAASLAKVIGCPTDEVVHSVVSYHQERLEAVPDLGIYSELRGYCDRLREEERGFGDAGVPPDIIALERSLEFWRATRLYEETGVAYYAQPLPANCRVLYLADSDRGALHLKNLDDPLGYWQPLPPIPDREPWPFPHPLVFDAVSSGLHIDEVPPEIFPVDVHALCREHCTTVTEAADFMVRYNFFWRSQNLLIHDFHGESIALEKTACRVAWRGPNSQGINYINEMGALDSDISRFQRTQRAKYLQQIDEVWEESPHGCAFTVFENQWRNLTRYVEELSLAPTWENAKQVMEQRDPAGPMCLTGEKQHPKQTVAGCTLLMSIYEMEAKRLHRRQWRGSVPTFLDTPEIVQFEEAH